MDDGCDLLCLDLPKAEALRGRRLDAGLADAAAARAKAALGAGADGAGAR